MDRLSGFASVSSSGGLFAHFSPFLYRLDHPIQTLSKKNDPRIRNEIEFHQTVLQVGQDQNLLAALGELHDNPALADQIQADPKAFVQSRRIHLPASAIAILASRPDSATATVAANFHVGAIHFGLRWNTNNGFSVYQLA
jgi:hypothetical protein